MDNMRIWNEVCKTDPKHTKPVKLGARQFTTVDAMYQIQRATERFGPVGEGWGYVANYEFHERYVSCGVEIWHGKRENYFGPFMAINKLFIGRSETFDEDAAKKAMTDALTKGLSHLGFSADVFLGQYDDNRYVQQMKREFAPEGSPTPPAVAQAHAEAIQHVKGREWLKGIRDVLTGVESTEELRDVWRMNSPEANKLKVQDEFMAIMTAKAAELPDESGGAKPEADVSPASG